MKRREGKVGGERRVKGKRGEGREGSGRGGRGRAAVKGKGGWEGRGGTLTSIILLSVAQLHTLYI